MKNLILTAMLVVTTVSGLIVATQSANAGCPGCVYTRYGR